MIVLESGGGNRFFPDKGVGDIVGNIVINENRA